MTDERDANYNDEWPGSESILRLTNEKIVTDSSISRQDARTPVAETPSQSSKQILVIFEADCAIQTQLRIKPDLQPSSHSSEMDVGVDKIIQIVL